MRKSLLQLAMSGFFILLISESSFSANEYFKSVATGNWNSIATWQMSTNSGATWFAATTTPNDTSGSVTIQSPNSISVTVSVKTNQIIVNSGGIISINSAVVLTIFNGSVTLYSGGTISGAGTLQTQGAVLIDNRNGSDFSAALKINTGTTSAYDPSIASAVFKGTITVDAGAKFMIVSGGYNVQANNNITNNGIITSSGGGNFYMRGASLINNDTISGSNFYFDSTTTLSGTGVYTCSLISIRSTGNVSLATNVTFSPTSSFEINNGGVFNPNTKTLTFNSGTCYVLAGGTTVNSGIFQTQGTVSMIIRSGSNFNAPFKVNTGTTTSYDDGGPYTANYKGPLTVDAGATLTTPAGGYSSRAHSNVTNNGTITGNNFIMRGPLLSNNGSISSSNLQFDSASTVVSTGTFTSNTITIGETGILTLSSNITFSPGTSFSINNGGVFNPGSKIFTFNSGSFIINTGGVVSGSGPSAGVMQSQNSVDFIFRNGSTFNSSIKVNTGTLRAYNDQYPHYAVFSGTITVDAGATLTQLAGGYTTQANNTLTNNGIITSPGGGTYFRMSGSSFINNSSVSCQYLSFDSITSISGTGSYTCENIYIGTTGNVSLLNNVTFSPTGNFTVNNGGVLNPNTRTITFNSGTFVIDGGGTVSNSGLIQTQGSVTVDNRNGSIFNAPFKVNTGTTLVYNVVYPHYAVFNGPITVDAGSTLTGGTGGYYIQAKGSFTNNGILTGSSTIIIRGTSLVNNNSITCSSLIFDSATTVSGSGSFTSSVISIGSSGNISLGSNVTFSPGSSFGLNSGGILNPNGFTFTANGNFYFYSGSTVTSSGTFRTQVSASLVCKSGSYFNGNLKVNTGTTYIFDDNWPYEGAVYGIVTIDSGALITTPNGGYTLKAFNNLTNNGTISCGNSGASFKYYGGILTNNGVVNAVPFYFDTASHTLQGTGSWETNAYILTGSTVYLGSNHKMYSLTVYSGGAFNLLSYKLSLAASNPIDNSGTFNTSTGMVEYNGTSAQSLSTTNVTYNKLRINNSAGAYLPGSFTVNDTLSVILGDLNLNGFVLTLAPAGYLTETAGNTVTGTSGYITTTRNLNAPSALNVGGLGAVLTTAVNLGSTEIRRGHTVQNGLNGNTSILRYFDITPTANTGLNATLVYKFDDSELNGKIESALSLYKSTNTGSTWTVQGGTVNTTANTITLSGIGSFSRWSASSASAVVSTIKLVLEGFYNTTTGRLNMRDTVRAYLRNSTTPFAVVDSAKSVIDSVTFNGSFIFANAPSGTYYIQIRHRNALETWSRSGGEAYVLGSALSYDFTTDSAKAYQNNMKKTGTKWALYEGDVNQEGNVDLSDVILIYNNSTSFLSGYVKADVNGDRLTDLSDVLIAYNNSVAFVSKKSP